MLNNKYTLLRNITQENEDKESKWKESEDQVYGEFEAIIWDE